MNWQKLLTLRLDFSNINIYSIHKSKFNPLLDEKILNLPKLKQIADDISKSI